MKMHAQPHVRWEEPLSTLLLLSGVMWGGSFVKLIRSHFGIDSVQFGHLSQWQFEFKARSPSNQKWAWITIGCEITIRPSECNEWEFVSIEWERNAVYFAVNLNLYVLHTNNVPCASLHSAYCVVLHPVKSMWIFCSLSSLFHKGIALPSSAYLITTKPSLSASCSSDP